MEARIGVGLREAFVRDKRNKEEQRLIYETKLNFSLAQNPIQDIFHEIENSILWHEESFALLDEVFLRREHNFPTKVFDILPPNSPVNMRNLSFANRTTGFKISRSGRTSSISRLSFISRTTLSH